MLIIRSVRDLVREIRLDKPAFSEVKFEVYNFSVDPIHGMFLNFRSDHPLEHKQSVVRSLIDRANALCSTTKNRQDEIKHVKDTLKLNSYSNTTLIKKPSNRTKQQFKGFAIMTYYPGLTEKIRRCLSNHNVQTVLKPCNTIGKKLANHNDSVDPNMRQGAVYQIPCHDCDFSYTGETNRSFSIHKKNT